MLKNIFTACFVMFSLTSNTVVAEEGQDIHHHEGPGQLSSCITACLKKDSDLHRESLSAENMQMLLQEKQPLCIANDYSLHAQTLRIFMEYGRSKDHILKNLDSFMGQNSIATMECLFSNLLAQFYAHSKATQDCLSQCEDSDFGLTETQTAEDKSDL